MMKKEDLTLEIIAGVLETADYGCSWKDITCKNEEAYNEASEQNKDIEYGYTFYYILARMLLNGKRIYMYDFEEDKDYAITLNKLLKGINNWLKYKNKDRLDIDNDDYDYYDCDGMIQYTVFGDIIYG